jgi:group I intron endonuclease
MESNYVYILFDSSKPGEYVYGDYKFDYEPFYVGKGINNRIKDTIYDKSRFKRNKIKSLREKGIDIITIKIHESVSNTESIEIEKRLISLIGRRDIQKGPLVNTTDGGDGRLGSTHSDDSKSKISKSRKGKNIGFKHKEETLKLMSLVQMGEGNGFFGKTHSLEFKEASSNRNSGLSHPMFGKNHTDEAIDKLIKYRKKIDNQKIKKACQKFNKTVLMFDLEMNFLKEFESVKQASFETGINASIISKCCRREIKKPTRFFFSYKKEEDNIKINKFLLSIGDIFEVGVTKYKLIKRNRKTCICETDGKLVTLRYSEFPILSQKDIISRN